MTNLKPIQKKVETDFESIEVKNQLASYFADNPQEETSFKNKVIKMSLNYGLDKCSPISIIKCGFQALSLDLPLEAGQGYIVNYGGVACLDAGYKGWQMLANREGFSVAADPVYACDEFEPTGYGFDKKMHFTPNYKARQSADDKWARENLTGVIVSIREDETNAISESFVSADLIMKIIGKSPSMNTENGRKHSPHMNWAEQMFNAKAIKYVLTKFPVDIAKASKLHQALEIVNNSEQHAQSHTDSGLKPYSESDFNRNFPEWKRLVETGQKTAAAVILNIGRRFALSDYQANELLKLKQLEPIDGEIVDA